MLVWKISVICGVQGTLEHVNLPNIKSDHWSTKCSAAYLKGQRLSKVLG